MFSTHIVLCDNCSKFRGLTVQSYGNKPHKPKELNYSLTVTSQYCRKVLRNFLSKVRYIVNCNGSLSLKLARMSCMRGPFNVDDSDMESDMQSSVSSCGADSTTNSQAEGNDMENGSDGNPGELEQMKMFAAVETARVNRWKLFVIITILVVGGAVSTFTFLTLSNEQSTDATNAVSLPRLTLNV
jgi:hypothetical protein